MGSIGGLVRELMGKNTGKTTEDEMQADRPNNCQYSSLRPPYTATVAPKPMLNNQVPAFSDFGCA